MDDDDDINNIIKYNKQTHNQQPKHIVYILVPPSKYM